MIAFLVFSDWFNPGDKDRGTDERHHLRSRRSLETKDDYDLQVKVAFADHQVDDLVRIAKAGHRQYPRTWTPG